MPTEEELKDILAPMDYLKLKHGRRQYLTQMRAKAPNTVALIRQHIPMPLLATGNPGQKLLTQ